MLDFSFFFSKPSTSPLPPVSQPGPRHRGDRREPGKELAQAGPQAGCDRRQAGLRSHEHEARGSRRDSQGAAESVEEEPESRGPNVRSGGGPESLPARPDCRKSGGKTSNTLMSTAHLTDETDVYSGSEMRSVFNLEDSFFYNNHLLINKSTS